MSRITLSILFVFALLALLLSQIFWPDEQQSARQQQQDSDAQPNYQAYAMHSVLYNPAGQVSHEVYAQQMSHFDADGYTLFNQPRYVIYVENRTTPWQISALKGKLSQDNLLQLEQGVMIQSTDEQGLVQTMQTSNLLLNLDSKEVRSTQDVVITGSSYIIESRGIRANLQDNTFEIGEHVRTIFQPAVAD